MLTIGQLARYVGVSTRTIRVYHDKGLLPEPARDASGYRRYGADDAIALIKVRILAEAGVPLARISSFRTATAEEFRRAVDQVDTDLSHRIRGLRATQRRLRLLADGHPLAVPAEVGSHLEHLTHLGFSRRWVALQHDLWILVFATLPDTALARFHEEVRVFADADLRALFIDYDRAHDLDPHDPRIDELARRIVAAIRERYGAEGIPGPDPDSEIPTLIQAAVNDSAPAWRRLDTLIREQLSA